MLAVACVVVSKHPFAFGTDDVLGQEGDVIQELGVSSQRIRVEPGSGKKITIIWYGFTGQPDRFDGCRPGRGTTVPERLGHRSSKKALLAAHIPAFKLLGKREQDQRTSKAPDAIDDGSVQHGAFEQR